MAEALAMVPGIVTLHDRRVRGTRGNIDHIVVAPAGVFVVDAKNLGGMIEVRDYGGWFSTDLRLTVGRRNKSHLAANMGWQIDAVVDALNDGGLEIPCVVRGVLCFVDGRWPIFRRARLFNNVMLESETTIADALSRPVVHSADEVQQIAQILARAFPPK